MEILVDSAFYIDKQRARKDVRQLLGPWLLRSELWSCGIIRAEVLRGILKPEIKKEMEEFFDLVPEAPADSRLWRQASQLAWELDRQGVVLPLTDLTIACCAMRENAILISTDTHFNQVPGLRVDTKLPE